MSTLRSRQYDLVFHNGIITPKNRVPFRLARIPVHGNRLEESILVHPRYVPTGTKHEIVRLHGFSLGRVIYVILDEPIKIGEKEYFFLSIKGTGADISHTTKTTRKRRLLAIDPGKQPYTPSAEVVFPITRSDYWQRIWGGLDLEAAHLEFQKAQFLIDCGLPFSPHLSVNPFPREVNNAIAQQNGQSPLSDYAESFAELVRAVACPIRLQPQFYRNVSDFVRRPYLSTIAAADAQFVKLVLLLAAAGTRLVYHGVFSHNRYLDGTFTDAENFHLEPLVDKQKDTPISSLIYDTFQLLSDCLDYQAACYYVVQLYHHLDVISRPTDEVGELVLGLRNVYRSVARET